VTSLGAPDLTGRRVLVTGGTRGIGAAIVDAAEAAGAVVLVHGTRAADAAAHRAAAKRTGARREYLHADFGDATALEAFCDDVRAREVDVLINNAGVNRIQTIDQLAAGVGS
jgi:3-oxoacyl-[acyl-carrier protein] reductase